MDSHARSLPGPSRHKNSWRRFGRNLLKTSTSRSVASPQASSSTWMRRA
ncbi:hypothetical protein H257_05518 [Aphanomyces astaci]|uniref:Uncharacterized protein n=1 Tax=Aphanomyces astaci TaxID=112090 RepID=W4GQH2_APHAT|nr:hypothetical protein H257_05518 [Aphanomyces astaci]ETV81990.1 hypothetical protein H257_05518 [Aphanomyces astaci]|eukprot:XP_009828727.1 hypothetical protein H257_05518 [Aphanomyces astaci]